MRSNIALLILTLSTGVAQAQPPTTFSSGSTGADGALTYAANLGTVYFPPSGLTPHPNNIYNFTTITIGAGTTVRLSGWLISGPVYWLALSDVTISGVLDLSGRLGHPPGIPASRAPSEPGAGGYSGGLGEAGTGQNATAGNGPGGGAAPTSTSNVGMGGTFIGNSYLVALVGGSGGAGGCHSAGCIGGGGGAGGGAILIASSTKITMSNPGAIYAYGGDESGSDGSGGSGGAIRLVSNTISAWVVYAYGGTGQGGGAASGGNGIIRLEAFTVSVVASNPAPLISIPYALQLPVGSPSTLSVTSVNGIKINANPFSFPDATITTGTPVPVVISGANVPSGTTGNLYIFSETGPDQVIPFTLTGTLASTTATVNVPYPSGGSRGFAKAVW